MIRFKTFLLVMFLVSVFTVPSLNAQDEGNEMQVWMEYMTPGWAHEMLAKSEGEWTADISMWMAPGTEPTKSIGESVNKMILGGRYLQSTYKSNIMGMEMNGFAIEGYDNALGKFVNIWIDNMGTGIMYMEGIYDKETKTVNYEGEMVNPTMKGKMKVRETYQFVDENTSKMEMFAVTPEGDFKTMEIVFSRKK